MPFTRPTNVKLPLASAVAVALAVPVRVTVAEAPDAEGVIEPEILKVVVDPVVKFTPVTLALLIVTDWLVGLNVTPVLVGVTV